jgi:hypothetical protein
VYTVDAGSLSLQANNRLLKPIAVESAGCVLLTADV